MKRLKIKLSIANRVYPLTITPDQEEGLRLAAQKIDSTIRQFEKSYSVQDKQDVWPCVPFNLQLKMNKKI